MEQICRGIHEVQIIDSVAVLIYAALVFRAIIISPPTFVPLKFTSISKKQESLEKKIDINNVRFLMFQKGFFMNGSEVLKNLRLKQKRL